MDKLIKTIAILIGIAILNVAIFIEYLSNTGLPGGEVGMAPFLVMLESLIAIVGSIVIYLLIRNRIEVTVTKTILIYQAIYLLTLIFTGQNPFDSDSSDVFVKLIQWTYLISFIVTIGLIIITKLFAGMRTD